MFFCNNVDMSFLSINNISYTYPPVNGEIETDENGNPILPKPIFDFFTAELPGSFTSLIGPNGSGKSTFMLLAAGRIKPQQGNISLFDLDIANISEEKRNLIHTKRSPIRVSLTVLFTIALKS